MMIQDVTHDECRHLLTQLHLGRIGAAKDNQPYVLPFYFSYDDGYLYSFSTVGQHIEWMRANPKVCVETDEIVGLEEWVSIVIFGHYQELVDTPELKMERDKAYRLLQKKKLWWEPGYTKTMIKGIARPMIPVYFRVRIMQLSGRHTAPDHETVAPTVSPIDQPSNPSIRDILAALRARLYKP
jgi:nitroimidazol reductase NimA-like FMN-containing flavoprotein (pyridoxamine 5'-phosphate oxidase superfamily)